MDFGSLGTGSHTYTVKVTTLRYYTSDGSTLSTSNYTKQVLSSTFTIGGTTVTKHTVSFNANGGTGSMSSMTISYGQEFTLTSNSFSRSGYSFDGWNLYRVSDEKWYVPGEGWLTASAISQYGYTKKLYEDESILTLDESWTKGLSSASNYIFYAVWESDDISDYPTQNTYVKIQATTTNNIKKTPYASSDTVRAMQNSEIFTATKVVKNDYGNYWYYVPAVDGYINADNVKYYGPAASSMITFDGTDISGNIELNSRNQYHLPGTVRQPGNVSVNLTAEIMPSGSSTATTSSSQTFSGKSLTLCSKSSSGSCTNALCLKLKFSTLSKGVEYCYKLTAKYTLYYCPDNDDSAIKSVTKTECSQSSFTISGTSTTKHTIYFNSNGGTGSMDSMTVSYGQDFTIPTNSFSRSGYTFQGWNLYRTGDGKWYVPEIGWVTDDDISSNGYTKKLYSDGHSLNLDDSWTKGYSGESNYVFYAVWDPTIASGTCGDNITWKLYNTGLLTISGTGTMTDYSHNSAPWYSNSTSIKSVKIESGVTSIGDYAFYYCTSLTSIEIPSSVTSIGDYAFYYCTSLTSVEIGDGVTSIGGYAFSNCDSLTSIEIGNSVTNIGDYAFSWCSSLTSVEIGESVTSIGDYAFYGCDSLTSIEIPDSVTSIGAGAFGACDSLTSIEIPDSVTSIGNLAFYECTSLTGMEIGDSVMSIGEAAFYSCSSLTSIEIPDSVTSIGNLAFYECTSLTSVEIGDGVTSIGNLAFYECTSLTGMEIGDSVMSIGEAAFYSCSSLTSIEIGDSVTSIGDFAFCECSSLTSIEIPDSVTSIGNNAFYDCGSLTSVVIGDSVTSVGEGAFYECTSLTSIEIPDSVTSIGNYAFLACDSLTNINVSADNDTYSSVCGVLFNKDKTTLICCPGGRSGAYSIPASVASIGDCAFGWCDSLTSIEIPDSVTIIGDDAFEYCTSLDEITFEHSSEQTLTIGSNAFYIYTSDDSTIATTVKVADIENKHAAISEYDWDGSNRTVTYTELEATRIVGDLTGNGVVDVEDVFLLRKAAAGLITLNDDQKAVADIYADGRYNALDVNLLRRFIAGIVTEIPYSA